MLSRFINWALCKLGRHGVLHRRAEGLYGKYCPFCDHVERDGHGRL